MRAQIYSWTLLWYLLPQLLEVKRNGTRECCWETGGLIGAGTRLNLFLHTQVAVFRLTVCVLAAASFVNAIIMYHHLKLTNRLRSNTYTHETVMRGLMWYVQSSTHLARAADSVLAGSICKMLPRTVQMNVAYRIGPITLQGNAEVVAQLQFLYAGARKGQ